MLSDRVRRRLELLDRDPGSFAPRKASSKQDQEADPGTPLVATPVARMNTSTATCDASSQAPWEEAASFAPSQDATEATQLPGREVDTVWGKHWLIQQSIETVWPSCHKYFHPTLAERIAHVDHDDEDLRELARKCRDRMVLLDLETCGLAGSMIFLIGVVHYQGGNLVLTQLWARNYAEEKAILQSLWNLVQDDPVLVTFNGKSFDWPQVHDRSTLHLLGQRVDEGGARHIPLQMPATNEPLIDRVHEALQPADQRPELTHVDLLHHARRRWRSQLPNCRLQTLERYICGRRRVGDLPGSEIPDAYHDYVRTGKLRDVHAILHHNALDLVTLLQLALVFVQDPSGERPRPT